MILMKLLILQTLRRFYKRAHDHILMTLSALMYESYPILTQIRNFLLVPHIESRSSTPSYMSIALPPCADLSVRVGYSHLLIDTLG